MSVLDQLEKVVLRVEFLNLKSSESHNRLGEVQAYRHSMPNWRCAGYPLEEQVLSLPILYETTLLLLS